MTDRPTPLPTLWPTEVPDTRRSGSSSAKTVALGAARNTGISAASGQYLTFIDGDDWVEPGYIDTCLAEISASPGTELWVFDYIDITSSGRYRQSCAADFWSCRNAAWNKIYRRDLIGEDRFDEDILYEDLAAVRPWVARAKQKLRVNRALYNYRNLREGSIMSSVDTTRFFDLFTAAGSLHSTHRKFARRA